MLKHINKRKIAVSGCLLLFVLIIALGLPVCWNWLQKEHDIREFGKKSYNGVFLGTYDISDFSEKDFVDYRGISILKAKYTLKSWKDISDYLSQILSSGNDVTNIYLGIDPEILWINSGRNEESWTDNLEKYLMPYIRERSDITYEILLPAPSLQYWVDLDSTLLQENLAVYGRFTADMTAYANVSIYFMGGAHWLNANPGNYQNTFLPTPHVLKKIFLYTFCDHEFQIKQANAAEILEGLREQIEREKISPAVYPDLSQWCIVFFGDSVIGYNAGSYSLPGVVEGLSGAQVYNCGQGGVPASQDPSMALSLNTMITHFLDQTPFGLENAGDYDSGLKKYIEEKHEGKRYCFVLNFGLNDYFGGHAVSNPDDPYDVRTYAGALRTGIKVLRENFPEAEILVTTPTYVMLFSGGTEKQGEVGGVLTDYVDLTVNVAEEMGVRCINNYMISGINENNWPQYLADGCHPNETGAFLLGEYILQEMEKVIADEK